MANIPIVAGSAVGIASLVVVWASSATLLGGETVADFAFRRMVAGLRHEAPSSTSRVTPGTPKDATDAALMLHTGRLCMLSFLAVTPQALLTAAVGVLQVLGRLSIGHIITSLVLQGLIGLWPMAGFLLFTRFVLQFHTGDCWLVEEDRAPACRAHLVGWTSLVSYLEAGADCSLIMYCLYCTLFGTLQNLVSVTLCLTGLRQAKDQAESRWGRRFSSWTSVYSNKIIDESDGEGELLLPKR